ncbi:type I toxin-antitoxin system Ibs family toxin [Escherichia coli]|nr:MULTISPECIES: type I toxin-antitoxin system Ibs family toxin [Enterobacteriaceae]MDD6974584.1 type I toxin-antitoxin system Ibs family toxin [Escherichia coli]MDO2874984.1 type I toxin-antitoxin system Ibs family toxin [Escherichia coli]MDY6111167.1 type I toxin-antitoxin system Ibs family toxin [Escherichia coli]MDY8685263.1 type I toxin-antitoxin system Ibs family toxin [Escherichia coli]MDY9236230.1 type I toxin-antitoxin system Ibs family toxin [Escherichia coli]
MILVVLLLLSFPTY